jgi:hypothetical protein
MPLISTRGAASAQGFGEFAQSAAVNYIEDVFSTYLYTGNGSTQTITNGINLSGKGGMVWLKNRETVSNHDIEDTVRGATKILASNSTMAEQTYGDLTAFNADGFTLGYNSGNSNDTGRKTVSWTFRKQAKFFDVVTYTGNGTTKTISHNLGSTPGCIIVKNTSSVASWAVYHRSNGNDKVMHLNGTQAAYSDSNVWDSYTPTATDFKVGGSSFSNSNGDTYVAYLFAHDAGGFGLSGSDNVISCGSFTTDGSGYIPAVTLGYEPQLLMFKASSTTGNWSIWDTMRGFSQTSDLNLSPNTSSAESDFGSVIEPTATGFQNGDGAGFNPSVTYIYIAIRRGPMKVPTSGTSVFEPTAWTGDGTANRVVGTTNAVDFFINRTRTSTTQSWWDTPRLTNGILLSNATNAETAGSIYLGFDVQTGVKLISAAAGNVNASGETSIGYQFRRAPGFFDVVCYTGDAVSGRAIPHNLGATPGMVIVKRRDSAANWPVMCDVQATTCRTLFLDSTNSGTAASYSGNTWQTAPTSTNFYVSSFGSVNASGGTYVAYLFATCAGVSKVGTYTGTGNTLQIDCGFTGGARFVLIKRTDSTGDWYVWDTARGIVSGNDPYLLLNSSAAEVTNTDYVDTYSAGFELSSTAPAALNANGGTYIFLAIA